MFNFIRTSTDEVCVKPIQYNHSNVVKKGSKGSYFAPIFAKSF